MKKTLQVGLGLLFLSGVLASTACAQAPIPNGDFENWNGNTPVGWYTSNAGPLTVISMTSDAHAGSGALKGSASSLAPLPIAAGTGSTTNPKVPYTDHPGIFEGFYKMATTSGDSLHVLALFFKQGTGIGAANFTTSTPVSNYTQFSVPIHWTTADSPDSMSVALLISSPHAGTTFYLDDLSFANSNGVDAHEATAFALEQNFPNPFNPSTTIRYSLTESSPTVLAIYDLTGSLVKTLVNEHQVAGEHNLTFDASALVSGVYFYRLTSGGHTVQHSMQLIK